MFIRNMSIKAYNIGIVISLMCQGQVMYSRLSAFQEELNVGFAEYVGFMALILFKMLKGLVTSSK